jgi:hypothetical protein
MPNESAPEVPPYVSRQGRTATLAIYVQVTPGPGVRSGDMAEIVDEVARRADRALRGIFENIPGEVMVDAPVAVGGEHVPFFPAAFGGRVHEDQTEVFAAVEALRKGTPLEDPLHDSTGRAFEVRVYATFHRAAAHDREGGEVWTPDTS